MAFNGTELYQISGSYDIAEVLARFDSNFIFDVIQDKLDHISFASSSTESNIVEAFETNFKAMNEQFPGDSHNIKEIRQRVYTDIIRILTEKFNLAFNYEDDTIDIYMAAYYLYDFLVCNRNKIMVNFFVAFIINNKDNLCQSLNMEDFRKSKDSAAAYGKRLYDDNKFAIISANINTVIANISELDVTLFNIFQSTYKDPMVLDLLANAFADKGNFFKNYYCSILNNPEELPIVITNIRLYLQSLVGNISQSNIGEFIAYANGPEE